MELWVHATASFRNAIFQHRLGTSLRVSNAPVCRSCSSNCRFCWVPFPSWFWSSEPMFMWSTGCTLEKEKQRVGVVQKPRKSEDQFSTTTGSREPFTWIILRTIFVWSWNSRVWFVGTGGSSGKRKQILKFALLFVEPQYFVALPDLSGIADHDTSTSRSKHIVCSNNLSGQFEWQTFHHEASSGDPYWMLRDLDHRGTKRLAEVCWVACLTHLCPPEILGWVPIRMSKGLYRMYYNAWVSHCFSDFCNVYGEPTSWGRSELLFSRHPVEERSI